MKTYSQMITAGILVSCLILSACGAEQTPAASPTLPPPSPTPTETATPLPTSTATVSPSPTSTPVGGNDSLILYEDYESESRTFRLTRPETKKSGILVSERDLKAMLPKDRYTESVFGETGRWGYNPFLISPDGKNILTSVCATLDAGRRCIYQFYVVSTDLSSITQLEVPGASSVDWRWSPDGKKLAGLASAYGKLPFEEPVAFYGINSDGTELTRIGEVPLNVYSMAWSSDSQYVYPLSLAAHFKAMPVDGSGEQKIEIGGLKVDDQITCLNFTADHRKVAFMVTRAFPKGHYRIYTANADFSEPSLTTEFDTDHASCGRLDWSPDQDYILIEFSGIPTDGGGFLGDTLDLIFEVKTGNQVSALPSTKDVCGWAPDGGLVYGDTITREIKLMDLLDQSEPIGLGLYQCPTLWLPQNLAPSEWKEISLQTSISARSTVVVPASTPSKSSAPSRSSTCHPGKSIKADPDNSLPAYLDLLEVHTELDGEILTTVYTLRDIPDDITINQITTRDLPKMGSGRPATMWLTAIDIDHNIATGLEGIDLQLEAFDYLPNSRLRDKTLQIFNLMGWVADYAPGAGDPTNFEKATISVDKVANTVTVSAHVKGITANSSLTFETSTYIPGQGNFTMKSLCD